MLFRTVSLRTRRCWHQPVAEPKSWVIASSGCLCVVSWCLTPSWMWISTCGSEGRGWWQPSIAAFPWEDKKNHRQRFTAGPHCCFFTISISSDCCAERLVPRCSFMTFNSGAWAHKHSAHPQTDPCPTANVRPALMLIPLQLPCFWA